MKIKSNHQQHLNLGNTNIILHKIYISTSTKEALFDNMFEENSGKSELKSIHPWKWQWIMEVTL